MWPHRQVRQVPGTWEEYTFPIQTYPMPTPALPITSSVTSGKLPDLSELQFFICKIGKIKSATEHLCGHERGSTNPLSTGSSLEA